MHLFSCSCFTWFFIVPTHFPLISYGNLWSQAHWGDILIHRLLRSRVTFPTWRRLFCRQRSSGGLKYRITSKANVHTCYCWLFSTRISWHCERAKVRRDCKLLRRCVWRDAVLCSLTQIGSDPHDVSLSVLAAVMEGSEAFEWAALHREAEYSSASRGDRSVFMLSGGKADCDFCCCVPIELQSKLWQQTHFLQLPKLL